MSSNSGDNPGGPPLVGWSTQRRDCPPGPNGSVRISPYAWVHGKESAREGLAVTSSHREDARRGDDLLPRAGGCPRPHGGEQPRPEHRHDPEAGREGLHLGPRARVRLSLREVQRSRDRSGQHARRRQRRDLGVEQQRDERRRRVRALPELDDGPQREEGPRGRQGARDDGPAVGEGLLRGQPPRQLHQHRGQRRHPHDPVDEAPDLPHRRPEVEVREEALRGDRRLPLPGHADRHEPQLDADPDPRELARGADRSHLDSARSRPTWSRSSR